VSATARLIVQSIVGWGLFSHSAFQESSFVNLGLMKNLTQAFVHWTEKWESFRVLLTQDLKDFSEVFSYLYRIL